MKTKDKIKPAAGSRATSESVEERVANISKGPTCNVLGSCFANTYHCPKLRICEVNAGHCGKLTNA